MLFDLPLEQLREYRPSRDEQPDFDEFWASTLAEARQQPLSARFEPFDVGLSTVESYDVTFCGYGAQPVRGWLLLPRHRPGPLPCVVEYIGYGGGRGFPTDWLLWASAGYAHLVMDTRSQGGGIALAVSGLVPDVQAAMPDVPFLCHYRRATEITNSYPYQEIARYLMIQRDKEDAVFATLAYFDGVNFAARGRARALFSVA